jgi:Domain of unknown function (DUF3425)
LFDASENRRSKAYFERKVQEGVAQAIQSRQPGHITNIPTAQDIQLRQNAATAAKISRASFSGLVGLQGYLRSQSSQWPPQATSDIVSSGPSTSFHSTSPTAPLVQGPVCTSLCFLASGVAQIPWYPAPLRFQQVALFHQPLHQIPAHQIPDVSALSVSFARFNIAAERKVKSGIPPSSVFGDIDTHVDLLFRPATSLDALTPANWACETAKRFIPYDVHTQLGYVFLISRLIRWNLCPTLENYILLPPIMRPTCLQRCTPQFPTADFQPLPVIREALVRGERRLSKPIGDVERAGTEQIKLYWPFGMEAALEQDPTTRQIRLSQLFEAAAADETSWSCGVDFAKHTSMAPMEIFNVVQHFHTWEGSEGVPPTHLESPESMSVSSG